jgi:CRP-like cAMP-binding protein
MNSFELFKKNSAFENLNQNELDSLFSISKQIELKPGEFLIREGEIGDQIFFILKGLLEVTRYDPKHKETHLIDLIHDGDTVGELAIFDQGIRSATVKAIEPSSVRGILYDDLKALANRNEKIYTIFFQLAKSISLKLRRTGDLALRILQAKTDETVAKLNLGQILIYSIAMLSIVLYISPLLEYAFKHAADTSYISNSFMVLFGVMCFFIIKSSRLPLEFFGITRKEWKISTLEGVILTIPILGVLAIIKWSFIHYSPDWSSRPFFEPFALLDPSIRTLKHWLFSNVLYVAFIGIQELFARGILQGFLMNFIEGKNKNFLAIILSSLMFGAAHTLLSIELALGVFVISLFLGAIYSRHRNLIGVWTSHTLIGMWGLAILGLISRQ